MQDFPGRFFERPAFNRSSSNDLTRENLLKQATSLKDIQPPLFLDGINVGNSPTDYRAIHNLQITRFDGANWIPVGNMVDLDGIAS